MSLSRSLIICIAFANHSSFIKDLFPEQIKGLFHMEEYLCFYCDIPSILTPLHFILPLKQRVDVLQDLLVLGSVDIALLPDALHHLTG